MKHQQIVGSFVISRLLPALALVALLAAAASPALAGKGNQDNPGVLPPQSTPHGQSYSGWSGAWWHWALGVPGSVNPLKDLTGENAGEGQSGSVWFLAGVWGASGPVTRECTVPTGKALFFPLVNMFAAGAGWVPEDDIPAILQGWRDWLKEQLDTANELACEIDGKPVANLQAYRVQSVPFQFILPEDNLFGNPDYAQYPDWLGVDDGYYLMLAPLSQGKHTIHFHARLGDGEPMDVTYHLTVK